MTSIQQKIMKIRKRQNLTVTITDVATGKTVTAYMKSESTKAALKGRIENCARYI